MNPDYTRQQRIVYVHIRQGWFEGEDYVATAMALPQDVEGLITLLKLVGITTTIDTYNTRKRFTFQRGGKSRGMSVEDKFPWDDEWMIPAAVLHNQMYDDDNAANIGLGPRG